MASSSRASDPLKGLVYAPAYASVNYYAYPSYAFDYSTNDRVTGDNTAQWEKRDGDLVTGAYSLMEPDGSLRIVEYWANGKSGFHGVVKRIEPNHHPTISPVDRVPVYKAPIPLLPFLGTTGPTSVVRPVAKLGDLASAPVHAKRITASVYPKANLLHGAPVLHTPLPTIRTAPTATFAAPTIPFDPIATHGGTIRTMFKYLPINEYSGLDFLDAKGPLLNAWNTPTRFIEYAY